MYLRELIKKGVETVSVAYPHEEAREMVFAYLEHVLGTKRHTHILEPEYKVPEDKMSGIMEGFGCMAEGMPLQYMTGVAWFYGRAFNVTPDVLIPRPETEILCREVLSDSSVGSEKKILDLCTGSGCIAWTLALEMPGAQVTAVDISGGALSVASSQDFGEEISHTGALTPSFLRADVLGASSQIQDKYDIIVSNPPYVMDSEKALMRTNVIDHEPHLALFVPDDEPLRFYKAIAGWARELLTDDGYGIVEINEALGEETVAVFRDAGFCGVRLLKDLYDKDRFVRFFR